MRKYLLFITLMIVMLLGTAGCGKASDIESDEGDNNIESESIDEDITIEDAMDIAAEENCQFYVMNIKGNTVEVYNEDEVHTRPLMLDNGVTLPEIEDGHFKKITAAVDIYYGGEGGYSGDKFIKKITKTEDADYKEVFEALEIRDASGNSFSAREMLKFQDMNNNYLLASNGHKIEVYKDGDFFTELSADEIIGTDYPEPFFETLEKYKETQNPEKASVGDASMGDADEYIEVDGYRQITPETAQKIMETEKDYIIVDVRHDDEYYDGHIPGAVLITNEYIEDKPLPELPDKDQMILVYCRSGRRSKDAARKLAAMGYTNVYEFGGIINWPGPIVTDE